MNKKTIKHNWPKMLCSWYEKHQRTLPWRRSKKAYPVWISEVMLQQTQVQTVIPYYKNFMNVFPSIRSLAKAPEDKLLKAWEGLGYYSRALRLKKAAHVILKKYHGCIPENNEDLKTLPGMGDYIASAISSICFEKTNPVVDGNVLRVCLRFWGIYEDIKKASLKGVIRDRLRPYICQTTPSVFNQAMMELGAMVCRPRDPSCKTCPLKGQCYAFQNNRVSDLPTTTKKQKKPHYQIAVAIVYKGNKILIAKRKSHGLLGGLWEFPGGKRKGKEALKKTAIREVKEETNIDIQIEEKITSIKHAYSHFSITLTAFRARYVSGKAKAKEAQALRWIFPEEIKNFAFPTANKKIFQGVDLTRQ